MAAGLNPPLDDRIHAGSPHVVHDQVPCRLSHPRRARVGGGAEDACRRVACSMTARTYSRVPVSVVGSKKSAAMMAWAWERRNVAQVALVRRGCRGCRVDSHVLEHLPYRGAPTCCSRRPGAARVGGWIVWSVAARPGGSGDPGVTLGDQVTVPAQHGFRADQQPDACAGCRGVAGAAEQRARPGQPRWADSLAVQLPLEDGDLVPQSQDLGVLVPVACR
jgi:hypothetical protein